MHRSMFRMQAGVVRAMTPTVVCRNTIPAAGKTKVHSSNDDRRLWVHVLHRPWVTHALRQHQTWRTELINDRHNLFPLHHDPGCEPV